MRNKEAKELKKCRDVTKMKMITNRQSNIAMEVKNGLMELEETIDVIAFHRTNWIKAYEEIRELETDLEMKVTAIPAVNKKSSVLNSLKKQENESKTEVKGHSI